LLRKRELPRRTAVEADEGTYKYLGYVSHSWFGKKEVAKLKQGKLSATFK
jgi:hypothetical protein